MNLDKLKEAIETAEDDAQTDRILVKLIVDGEMRDVADFSVNAYRDPGEVNWVLFLISDDRKGLTSGKDSSPHHRDSHSG